MAVPLARGDADADPSVRPVASCGARNADEPLMLEVLDNPGLRSGRVGRCEGDEVVATALRSSGMTGLNQVHSGGVDPDVSC